MFRRRFRRRRFTGNRRRRFGSRRIRRIARGVVRNQAETKFFIGLSPVYDQSTVVESTSFVNAIQAGVGNNQRIGSQIRIQAISWRITAIMKPAVGGAAVCYLRVVLLYPRKGQDDVGVTNMITSLTVSNFIQPNIAYVLYDKVYALGVTAGDKTIMFNKHSKKCRYIMNYSGGVINRQPILVLVTDLPPGDPTKLSTQYYQKTSFKDI